MKGNYKKLIEDYVYKQDWRVKENSTTNYSISGLHNFLSSANESKYWLEDIYTEDIGRAHMDCDFHLHDLGTLASYCSGWSLKELIQRGLNGVQGKISSAPAKHLTTLVNQMVNFIGIMSNEWAGAQAFSSFDTYLAPFVRADNLNFKEVKQAIQNFVFGLNIASRWGGQAPFSNITLDWVCPDDIKNEYAIVGGIEQTYKYGELAKEMEMINKAFLEIMIEGDSDGRGFQYPIPTYNLTKDFIWEGENADLLFEMTAKYGTPYFQNFINSDLNPSDVRSMCCRLQLSKRELMKKTGGLFGAGEKTGSVGVVTINLPKIAYLSKNKEEFFDRLKYLMNLAKNSLETKRKILLQYLELGMYPYTKAYLEEGYKTYFSTIGLVGMNEMCLNANWIKKDLMNEEAIIFSEEVLEFMKNKIADYQEETSHLYNLEATPAESTTYRFAKHDKERYPHIITAGESEVYYTNSCHLPVGATEDPFEALDIQERLQTKFTGGTVFHTFIGEKISDINVCKSFVRKIAEGYRIPYFSITPTYSICKHHGYISGEEHRCPTCQGETEVYSRITGYYRAVKFWNDGKVEEFDERTEYKVCTK